MLRIIKELCKLKRVSIPEVEKAVGMGRGSLYGWDRSSPSVDKVAAVADYFDVSVDEIIGRTPKASSVSTVELALLRYFRELNENGQAKLLNEAEFLSRQPEYIKSDIREIEA